MTDGLERFTPQAKEALNLAREAAEELGHDSVGTEHLLVGLMREESGVASRAWRNAEWTKIK